ncbi:MAG: hypothetical protein ABI222_03105 [Opitutaceae bacterium]
MLSLLLVALWLPATQHCAMQVTGLIPTTCPDEQSSCASQNAAIDGCSTVENAAYSQATPVLKAPVPILAGLVGFLCNHCVFEATAVAAVAFPRVTMDRPLDWVRTWQFTQRAALPARAPSILGA